MLKQIIAQFDDFIQLTAAAADDHHHYSPSDDYASPFLVNITYPNISPLIRLPRSRWCSLSFDDSSHEDDCCSFSIRNEKLESSGNFEMFDPGKPPTKRNRKDLDWVELTGTTDPVEKMEDQIWKELPEDLFEAVIARLPVASFFRFRSVCRKWDSLPTSHSFSQQCAQVPQAQPWFYTVSHENVDAAAMYDPALQKWYRPTVPALPTNLNVLPLASAGGLVCFLDIGQRSFYVCNPLTKFFKELPRRSIKVWSRVAVGMALNEKISSGGYKILWVGCDGEYEVYDSRSNSWTRPISMPSSIKLPLSLNFNSQAVCVDGLIYFMRSDPEGILSYNMKTGIWKQFIVPAPQHLSDHMLAECDGKILLVGLLTKNAATCVYIWELQKMTLLWKEVDRMPNEWCLEFYGKHIRMTCLGNNGLFMLSLKSKQMNRIVTYDVTKRQWVKVPRCVLPHGSKEKWISCGTSFHPCLTNSE